MDAYLHTHRNIYDRRHSKLLCTGKKVLSPLRAIPISTRRTLSLVRFIIHKVGVAAIAKCTAGLLTQLAVYGNSEVKWTESKKALVVFMVCDAGGGLLIKHKPDANAGPQNYFSFIKPTHSPPQRFPEILPFPTNALRPGRLKPDGTLNDASFWVLKPRRRHGNYCSLWHYGG